MMRNRSPDLPAGETAVTEPAAEVPRGSGDLESAPVYWMLGLPFELIDMQGAIARVNDAAGQQQRLVIATPNVNFLTTSRREPDFHACLLAAQLSLVDGMPLVWLGRWLGVPFPERVAGSDLIERYLYNPHERPLRIFFLGGDEGVAAAACDVVNGSGGALEAVGCHNPGFGSLDELSTPAIIDAINASGADLLAVSLGATKGHAWIERNKDRLNVPVISHLGAVVNFLAGTVRRAPGFVQRAGFEWLWRITQQPALASRYARDGVFLCREFATAVVPLILNRWRRNGAELKVRLAKARTDTIRINGALNAATLPELEKLVESRVADGATRVDLDMSGVTSLDCRALGYIYELTCRGAAGVDCRAFGGGRCLARQLRRHRAEALVDYQRTPKVSDAR